MPWLRAAILYVVGANAVGSLITGPISFQSIVTRCVEGRGYKLCLKKLFIVVAHSSVLMRFACGGSFFDAFVSSRQLRLFLASFLDPFARDVAQAQGTRRSDVAFAGKS